MYPPGFAKICSHLFQREQPEIKKVYTASATRLPKMVVSRLISVNILKSDNELLDLQDDYVEEE